MEQFINKTTRNLKREVKAHPYQVLSTAASVGYLFGQGWFRAFTRIGMAYLAQQATSQALPGLGSVFGSSSNQKTIH